MGIQANIKSGARIPELDGVRGLAILLVVLYHYVFGGLRPRDGRLYTFVHAILPLGWTGVDLFFVLSGFLIGGILIDHRHTRNYFGVFYTRRVCRIFPLYFSWLGLFAVLSGVTLHYVHHQWMTSLFDEHGMPTWLYSVYLQNFHTAETGSFGPPWLTVTWSLAVEEQFYLIIPFLIWMIPPRRILPILVSLFISIPIIRLMMYLYYPGLFVYVLLPCRADSLLIGVICAWMIRQQHWRDRLEKRRDWLQLALLVLMVGMVYLSLGQNDTDVYAFARSLGRSFLGYSWIALFYACLLLVMLVPKRGAIASIMRFSVLRNLGIISYCVYIIHMPIFAAVRGSLGKTRNNHFSSEILILVASLVTLSLATLSWHFFEKPIIRWGHSFSYASGAAAHDVTDSRATGENAITEAPTMGIEPDSDAT